MHYTRPMVDGASGRRIVDGVGLGVIVLVLLDLLRPSLLLLPTLTAGGDTPCHYPAAAWFAEELLPSLRLHGWYPGAYLGHPLLLYYFPLPFVLMAVLSPLVGLPVAFKLGTVLGVFLLPLLVYVAFRLMKLPFPAPLLGAAASLVFLFVEDNPIWGGTIASTLTGEFSYTYGVGLAVLFLGVLVHAHEGGRGPWVPGATLALVASAHGYAVLWAGLTASGLLLVSPKPARTLPWLLVVAAIAFGLAAPLLVPLIADWGWTTPYDDAWIDVTTTGLVPPLLWPLLGAAGVGVVEAVRRRHADPRLVLLGFGAIVGAAFAAAGPALGVIDVRFVPLAQLSACLVGAGVLGMGLARLRRADLAALGLVLLAVFYADVNSRVLRHWVDWNYTGLEAKELWPAWSRLNEHLAGELGDPRVAVEYGPVHEKAGSIRMYETLPFFSGRSTLEGVYNQASTTTHPVYYLASELFFRSPNPFRSRTYSTFDPATALGRLRHFDVGHVVAVSPELRDFLDGRDDVAREVEIPPYSVFRLREPGPGLVEPLAYAPVRAPADGWRDASYRWMTRKPPNRAFLVFTGDEHFKVVHPHPFAPPPEVPLSADVDVETTVQAEEIRIRTSRPGHPLLVKSSYHPRWRAEGARGPYLVSPGLMLVVPDETEVRLRYAARAWPDAVGWGLALVTVLLGVGWRLGGRPGVPALPDRAGPALAGLPIVLVLLLAAGRLLPASAPQGDVDDLAERASRAYAERRWGEAAEYARHAVALLSPDEDDDDDGPRRSELLWVGGQSLLEDGHPREALPLFEQVVDMEAPGVHRPQALFSGAEAQEAAGNLEGAREWRRRLGDDYPDNPWTERLTSDTPDD